MHNKNLTVQEEIAGFHFIMFSKAPSASRKGEWGKKKKKTGVECQVEAKNVMSWSTLAVNSQDGLREGMKGRWEKEKEASEPETGCACDEPSLPHTPDLSLDFFIAWKS